MSHKFVTRPYGTKPSNVYPPAYTDAYPTPYPSIIIDEAHNTEEDIRRLKELLSEPASTNVYATEITTNIWKTRSGHVVKGSTVAFYGSVLLNISRNTQDVLSGFRVPSFGSIVERGLRIFVSKTQIDAMIGDLQEESIRIEKRFGIHAARRWYCRQLLGSVPSLLWDALKRLSGLQAILKRIG
jgi:hypothetical protein